LLIFVSYRTLTEANHESFPIRSEVILAAWAAFVLGLVSLAYCFRHDLLLLYGDAVAHLYIARRTLASRNPGFRQLGSVWLPLPHILLLPFVSISAWWRNGLAGAWVSIPSYILGCAGVYRLARVWLPISAALVAFAFYALNPGLLYMATTAMTEPLFLAEMVWATLLIALWYRARDETAAELAPGLSNERSKRSPKQQSLETKRQLSARRLLIWAAIVLVCAIFTRYDGWILAAAAWCLVTIKLVLRRPADKAVIRSYASFSALLVIAPAIWVGYNAKLFGDPLDFLRGPYSARAIEARTGRPGGPMHPGDHSMHVAALYFLKAAEMGAVPVRFGNWLLWLSAAGTLIAIYLFGRKQIWPALLLWVPFPFYVYSVAYGSVPIFIPLWWPFSWYNTRYGMELLPAFAFFTACSIGLLRAFAPRHEPWVVAVLLILILSNSIFLLRSRPLVFEEAVANSRTRIAFEKALANALLHLPAEGLILMYTSQDAGAVQLADVSLHRIVSEEDYLEWQHALDDPAQAAPFVIALDGDPVANAIQRHPQGLELMEKVCSTGQPCARIYHSQIYTPRFPALSPGKGGTS
jgi:hypothetical protein